MSQTNPTEKIRDVYEIVTNRIIADLEKGVVPWKKTWTESGLPQNLVTRKPYRGINLWLLSSLGYSQNYFLSFKQLIDLGGKIKLNEKPHLVVFWKRIEVSNEKDSEVTYKPLLRYYRVFNVEQCDNLSLDLVSEIQKPNDPISECETIIRNMPNCPLIKHGGDKAFYHPASDYIQVPRIIDFDNSQSYYETVFHELVHSTGHVSRLNRTELMKGGYFGSDLYSQEELTAELGACYLKSHAGLTDTEFGNNVAYIQGWLKKLKNDKKVILFASVQAQKGVDYILSRISN